jgi:hypothetical protein
MHARVLNVVLAVLGLCLVMATARQAGAQDYCGRSWVANPNGFSNANGTARVHAMVNWDPDGGGPQPTCLVAAGEFTLASDVIAFNIAYWDGTLWRPLGNGLSGVVRTLAVVGGQLYAGGDIFASGGTPLNNFVRWNGSGWQNVAGGCDGTVHSLWASGSELLVGGEFTSVAGGAIQYAYFAAYLTTGGGSWQFYGVNPPRAVQAVAMHNGMPLAICAITEPQTQYSENSYGLYRFDGSVWVVLGVTDSAALTVFGNNIYYSKFLFSGTFQAASGCSRTGEHAIIRHDGTSGWLHSGALYRKVSQFAVISGNLYAIGYERRACYSASGPDQQYIAVFFNQTSWSTVLTPGPGATVLSGWNGMIHAAGTFDGVSPVQAGWGYRYEAQANCIAQHTGAGWRALSNQLNGEVFCSTSIGSTVYIGGNFTGSGSNPLGYAAFFNGQSWRPVAPFNGPVYSMRYHSPNPQTGFGAGLVVSGAFTSTGPHAAAGIAQFDQATGSYKPMGTGLNGPALALMSVSATAFRNDLVVGGLFTTAGGVGANYVARWQLGAWGPMGTGMNSVVRALGTYGGSIIAGGAFTVAGGNACSYLARWDGTTWQPLGGGLNGPVFAIANFGGNLIVAGDFTAAGGVPCLRIASWNGSVWSPVGGGFDAAVTSLAVSGSSLLAAGSFTSSGATLVSRVAQWNGQEWSQVGYSETGGGVDGAVSTISVASNGDLVAGGQFTNANGQFSPMAARAVAPGSLTAVTQPLPAQTCPGDEAGFTFETESGVYFFDATCQWYLNGNLLAEGVTANGSVVSIDAAGALRISNAAPGDAGTIWARATTPCGQTVLSNAADFVVGGPTCAACGTADFDGDGDIGTDADIESFFACLAGNCCGTCWALGADFNGDGDIGTDADIEAFFRVLAGGAC